MRRAFLVAILFLSLTLTASAFAANLITLDGGIEVTVVEDISGGSMDIELFEGGPLTKEQKLKFMPGGKAPSSVNAFLVKAGDKTYLLDTGLGNAIKDKKVDPAKIDVVLITHAHFDHVGGLLNEITPVFKTIFTAKQEKTYWMDAKTPNSDAQKLIEKAYGDAYKTYSFGDTLAPGIVAVDASGHTPGHTAFLVGTGKKKMLIAGDFLHAAALQFPNPGESAKYDVDKKAAAEMRKKLMQMCIDNGWLIAGMHIPGGFGSVKADGKGGFVFTPHK